MNSINMRQFIDEWVGNKTFTLVDVREPSELQMDGKVAGSLDIPMGVISKTVDDMNKDTCYVIMCASGGRSLAVTNFMKSVGFTNVVSLDGGFFGLSMVRPDMVEKNV